MSLGPFSGLIYTVILIVDCLFFLILEWASPREDIDFVRMSWDRKSFEAIANRQGLFNEENNEDGGSSSTSINDV